MAHASAKFRILRRLYHLPGFTPRLPSNVQNGTYTSCEGDVKDVGVYNPVNFLGAFCNYFGCVICGLDLVDACNVSRPSSLHSLCPCLVEPPDFPSDRSLHVYIHREFFLLLKLLDCIIIILTAFYRPQRQPWPPVPDHPVQIARWCSWSWYNGRGRSRALVFFIAR